MESDAKLQLIESSLRFEIWAIQLAVEGKSLASTVFHWCCECSGIICLSCKNRSTPTKDKVFPADDWNVEPSFQFYQALILFLRRRDGINKIFPFKTSDPVQYIYRTHVANKRVAKVQRSREKWVEESNKEHDKEDIKHRKMCKTESPNSEKIKVEHFSLLLGV